MSVDATLVYGMRLFYSADGVTYTEVADLKEMGPPGSSEVPDTDVTPLTPTAGVREFRAGLVNSGEIDFKQFWNKTRHGALLAMVRTTKYWRVTYPDNATPASASKVEFQGYVKKCTTSSSGNPDDPVTIDCTVKITTVITFTAGS